MKFSVVAAYHSFGIDLRLMCVKIFQQLGRIIEICRFPRFEREFEHQDGLTGCYELSDV